MLMKSTDNIIVTGGVGYVGRELVRQLLADGCSNLHVIDSLACGEHRLQAMDTHRFTLHRVDLRDAPAVEKVLTSVAPSMVIHLAAVHYIPACEAAPGDAISINVAGTVNLLTACRGGVPFVFASTAAVYAPNDEAHVEALEAPGPIDIYGLTKLHGEKYVEYFHAVGNIRGAIVRLFNVIGPGETNPHLVPAIISQLGRREHRVKLGNLFPRRDYIDVSDAASGFMRIGMAIPDAAGNGPVVSNLGTGKSYTVSEMVEQIGLAAGVRLEIAQDDSRVRKNDRPHLKASTARLSELTGWTPQVTLLQSLDKAWAARVADGLA